MFEVLCNNCFTYSPMTFWWFGVVASKPFYEPLWGRFPSSYPACNRQVPVTTARWTDYIYAQPPYQFGHLSKGQLLFTLFNLQLGQWVIKPMHCLEPPYTTQLITILLYIKFTVNNVGLLFLKKLFNPLVGNWPSEQFRNKSIGSLFGDLIRSAGHFIGLILIIFEFYIFSTNVILVWKQNKINKKL